MNLHVILQIILVVELFSTLGTEVLVVCSLLVNISQMLDQVLPEKKLFMADAAGNIEVPFGAMLFSHVAIQLTSENVM